MTALDTYFEAIQQDNLPASVPVHDHDGSGIATVTFDCWMPDIAAKVFSSTHQDRALMAIYACQAARETIVEELPEIQAL